MCLLAIFFRAVPDAPLVVGANREEYYARGGTAPQMLTEPAPAVAGLDPVAGGTWFGVNAHGLLVAVTNRPKTKTPADPRSRGLLTRDLLASRSAADALRQATDALGSGRYAGCNLLCADAERVAVVHASDWMRVRLLPPGIHVLANYDVNDASDPRVHFALDWLGQVGYATGTECLHALEMLCGRAVAPAICLRGKDRGTLSSSLVLLPPRVDEGVYLHAQGPPDTTPYDDYSHLLRQLSPVP
jgi:uncharacterized protein with NRDE domain